MPQWTWERATVSHAGDYGSTTTVPTSDGVSATAADTAVSALSAAVASGALAPAPDVGGPNSRQHPAPMPMPMSPMVQYTLAALGDRTIETKLLLHNSRVGVVIGKGGSMINHIRDTSKATLDVSESGALVFLKRSTV